MFIENNFNNSSDIFALIDPSGKKITYRNLYDRINYINSKIDSRNLIFVYSDNSQEFIEGYLSFLKSKNVIFFIESKINKKNLYSLIRKFKPNFLYFPIKKIKDINFKFSEILKNKDYILIKIKSNNEKIKNNDLALMMSTSGSMGSAKYVKLSYSNIEDNTINISKSLKINKNDKVITTLPPNYSYGLSIINTHIYKKSSIVLNNFSFIDKNFWNSFYKNKVSTFGGVPYTFEILFRLGFNNLNLQNIRYITQAGGKISDFLHNEILKLADKNNFEFIVMYGQTEASPRMSYLPHKNSKHKIGSIGLPIPGGSFFLKDSKNKKILKSNIEGNLYYKGKNIFLGYSNSRLDLNLISSKKNILNTGDRAKKDNDGYYFLTGRKKRIVKIYGNRYELDKIEKLINNNSIECACICKNDKLLIYLTNNKLVDRVKKILNIELNLKSNSYEIIILKIIKRNQSGKILYSKL